MTITAFGVSGGIKSSPSWLYYAAVPLYMREVAPLAKATYSHGLLAFRYVTQAARWQAVKASRAQADRARYCSLSDRLRNEDELKVEKADGGPLSRTTQQLVVFMLGRYIERMAGCAELSAVKDSPMGKRCHLVYRYMPSASLISSNLRAQSNAVLRRDAVFPSTPSTCNASA